MLRTNSTAARLKIRKYIRDNYDSTGYDLPTATTFPEIAANIMKTFRVEKRQSAEYIKDERRLFHDWCFGLPSVLCCDFLLRDTNAFVAALLEQTPTQAAKYTDEQSSDLMVSLIYNELKKANNEI